MKPLIGVIMLDTTFERPAGDIGNEKTFPYPVIYEKVERAYVSEIVIKTNPELLNRFISAAKILEQRGAEAITTSCGFLILFQKEIQEQLSVPFYSSSLLQVPFVQKITGGPVGVITASANHLTNSHLEAAGIIPNQVHLAGMDQMPVFTGAIILENLPLDQLAIAAEMKAVTENLLTCQPDISAIVLECTNMPPYRQIIKKAAGLPVFDIVTLTNYVYESL